MDFKHELDVFQNHLAETTGEILDVIDTSNQNGVKLELDPKFDVTITVNGKTIVIPCSADIYSSIDLIINEEREYLTRGGR